LRKFTRLAVEDEVHKRRLTECENSEGRAGTEKLQRKGTGSAVSPTR
jgi:hypothetical protein